MVSYCAHAPSTVHNINSDQSRVRGARAQETTVLPLPPHPFDSPPPLCYSPRGFSPQENRLYEYRGVSRTETD